MRSAGYSNVDFRAADGKITVVRVPAYSPHAVAEHAAALLLAGLERRCGYCCVNTVHLQTRTLESLCLVYDSDMLLRLEPGEEETEDWIVRRSTPEQIRRTLRALVREGAPQ